MSGLQITLEIEYHVDTATDDSQRFRQAALWVAERFNISALRASISIVDDDTIQELNRTHLDHDWPTDVISFVIESQQLEGGGSDVDGEIIASFDTAARLYSQAGWRHNAAQGSTQSRYQG